MTNVELIEFLTQQQDIIFKASFSTRNTLMRLRCRTGEIISQLEIFQNTNTNLLFVTDIAVSKLACHLNSAVNQESNKIFEELKQNVLGDLSEILSDFQDKPSYMLEMR